MSIHHRTSICLIACVLLMTWAGHASGQETTKPADPELDALDGRVMQFFKDVSTGEADAAFQELLTGSQLAKQEKARAALVQKTDELAKKYGAYVGAEQVLAKRIGKDLVLMRYLYKCEDFPVVWYFAFYRTPSKTVPATSPWRVISVRFDTELHLLAY